MQTDCSQNQLEFEAIEKRKVVAAFDGGAITSDAGVLLTREVDKALRVSAQAAACFNDRRNPDMAVHRIKTLIAQRIHGIALGYEDVNDHDDLRHDPALALLSDRLEPKRADCATLAGKSTLNRLEQAPSSAGDRYHKISVDEEKMERLFVDLFLRQNKTPPDEIIIDLDATDDPLHGDQEGKFFHGYYGCYCYLPLYIFCGRDLLAAKLRRSNIDGASGSLDEMARIIPQIREQWFNVNIELRADRLVGSGFCRNELMAWCEENDVGYVFGLAKNDRLLDQTALAITEARLLSEASGKPERVYTEFTYRTRKSWSRARRVIAKAEYLPAKDGRPGKVNTRFIVTSRTAFEAQEIYEKVYCARGDMENRIKECQLDLFADRTSTGTMGGNQLRLWFASLAYVLVNAVRRFGLKGTELAKAMPGTIRRKLFKIGALVKVSVRRVKLALSSGCPYRRLFEIAHSRLRTMAA